ncbi:MAG: hypothetical protein QOJ99_2455 [Bryobacterales bacterium]|nr:hypothetical protein [Bryobacterales bacterium]
MGSAVAAPQSAALRVAAYAAVFILWGGSFLAVREVVAVAPPFMAASFRFLVAGLFMLAYSRATGAPVPAANEVRSTALLGFTMFGLNYACLFWAEQRVASGYAAIISSTVPVWVFAGEWLWLRSVRPRGAAIAGMVLGICGVALLVLPGGQGEWTYSALALLTGTFCWAGGTLWSRRVSTPRSRLVSAGLQMSFGGTFLCLLSFGAGEFSRLSFLPH